MLKKPEMPNICAAEDMRCIIDELRMHNPIVSQVMKAADYSGMSGKDRYTMLAYYLLKQNETLREQLIEVKHNSVTRC